ncbi:unnamed protein product [Victoria cruziana]
MIGARRRLQQRVPRAKGMAKDFGWTLTDRQHCGASYIKPSGPRSLEPSWEVHGMVVESSFYSSGAPHGCLSMVTTLERS